MYERKDAYYRRAKRAGLRSRAAFKLEDLARGVVRAGDRVLDLGSWPGGWLQVASRLVGPTGLVVGVDVKPLDPVRLANVRVVQGDVALAETTQRVRQALGGAADVVLSDMAPKLSGIRERDEARSEELVRLALDVAAATLRPGGSFVGKVFMGPGYPPLLAAARRRFEEVTATKPAASRKGSSELYWIAWRFRSR